MQLEGEDAQAQSEFAVGDIVKLSASPDAVREAFDTIPYIWDDMMIPMCGQTFTVLEDPTVADLPDGVIGLASPDGSQGHVWYFPTSVVQKLRDRKEESLLKSYSMAVGKAVAGLARFLLEDILQAFCQCVFLIKMWHHTTLASKAFTLMSMLAGIVLSLAVPLKEYLSMKSTEKEATAKRPSLVNDLRLNKERTAADLAAIQEKGLQSGAWRERDVLETTIERDMYIEDFLTGKGYTTAHSGLCHKVLMCSCASFWVSMLALLFIGRPSCGGTPPFFRHIIFMLLVGIDLAVQFWVILHSRLGYHLVVFKPWKLASGAMLTALGRFDTYADVTFTAMVQNCEDITWFSIKERYFHMSYWRHETSARDFEGPRIFPLPCELSLMSLLILVIGVFLLQALPGFIALQQKKYLTAAFKANESNLLLTLMQVEAAYFAKDGDQELIEWDREGYELCGSASVAIAGESLLSNRA